MRNTVNDSRDKIRNNDMRKECKNHKICKKEKTRMELPKETQDRQGKDIQEGVQNNRNHLNVINKREEKQRQTYIKEEKERIKQPYFSFLLHVLNCLPRRFV